MRERTLLLGTATGAIGAAGAALLSVSCCVIPALYGALGAAGAVAAHSLTPYRPLMLGSSVVFLGFGFWRAYRPREAGCDGCYGRRRAAGRGSKAVLWIAALVVLTSSLSPLLLPSAQADSDGASPAIESRVLVRIDGMTCAGCNQGVSAALAALPAISLVEASFSEGAACATLTGPIDEAEVRRAVTGAGYTVTAVEAVDRCPEGLRGKLKDPWHGKTDGLDVVQISAGEQVDVAAHLAPGKYTVIDYGASWCGPCHTAADQLAEYLRGHTDVAVRVVQLGGETADESYAQPVVAQHLQYVRGIPWLVVHAPDGKVVTRGQSVDKAIAAIDRHRSKAR